MLDELLERKNKLEHEIWLMNFIDKWRPEQRKELDDYQIELREVESEINELTKKEMQ